MGESPAASRIGLGAIRLQYITKLSHCAAGMCTALSLARTFHNPAIFPFFPNAPEVCTFQEAAVRPTLARQHFHHEPTAPVALPLILIHSESYKERTTLHRAG